MFSGTGIKAYASESGSSLVVRNQNPGSTNTDLSKYTYTLTTGTNENNNKIRIITYTGNGEDLVIPATFTVEGVLYHTVLNHECRITDVGKLSFERGVVFENNLRFSKGTLRSSFEEIDLTGVINKQVSISQHLFSYNDKLQKITWGDFDITGYAGNPIRSTEFLVGFCTGLTELDLQGLKLADMKNMWDLCYGCTGLETLNLAGCDFGGFDVTATMAWDCGLNSCTNLKYIYAPIKIPAAVQIELPGVFVDGDGNQYKYLPTGL